MTAVEFSFEIAIFGECVFSLVLIYIFSFNGITSFNIASFSPSDQAGLKKGEIDHFIYFHGFCEIFASPFFIFVVLDEFPDISSCVHFAGLKAVGESVSKPLLYYDCNIGGTVNLLEQLGSRGIKKFVFSSSATVYGEPEMLPLVESARLQATNPYGRTKLFIEEILRDCHASDPAWNVLILRVSRIAVI